MSLSIRTKLLLLFLVLAFVPMVIAGVVSYYHSLRSVETVVEQEAMSRLDEVAVDLTRLYEDAWSEARLLARNRDVQGMYDALDGRGGAAFEQARPGIEGFFGQFFTGSRQAFCRVRYFDAGGDLIFEYGRQPRAAAASAHYSFSSTRSPPQHLELKPNEHSSQTVSNEFDPVFGAMLRFGNWVKSTEDGSQVGFVLTDVEVEHFLRDTELSPDPKRKELLAILGRDVQKVVAHPQSAAVGHPFRSVFPQIEIAFSEIANQSRGWTRYEEADGVSLVTYVNLDEVPWTLVAVNPRTVFTARVEQAAFINLGIILAAAILALILIPVIIGRVTTSIRRVAAGAEALADGDLDHEIAATSSDETAELADSFNRMARSLKLTLGELQALTDNLENRVRLRTAELEEANRQIGEANRDLTEAKEIAETANRAKSEFLANISHEIRTPMNAILGYAQIMRRSADLSAEQRHAVETIQRSGDHLLGLINDVLDISKIEAGRMGLNPSDFDLNELVRPLAVMFELRCNEKGLDWKVEGIDEDALWVRGDESKLRQVLMNLLSNAVKFTDEGTVLLRVAADVSGNYRFDVIDSGVGISAEDQQKLFDPFEQGAAGVRFGGGTGLGLTIASRQVELMGGQLTVSSAVGEGSQFSVAVPLSAAAAGRVAERTATYWSGVRHLAPGHEVKALVADDVQENRDILRRFLEDLGAQVQTADDGVEALARLESFRPAIVFMDVRMPKMDGMEALQKLRAREQIATEKEVKVVAVSASVLEHERQEFLAADFDGFLGKPFRFEAVCECLSSQLNVEFEVEKAADADSAEQKDWRGVKLPEDLLSRARHAAELYSVTDLETYFREMEQLGAEQRGLAAHLRELRLQLDLDSIRAVLEQVEVAAH